MMEIKYLDDINSLKMAPLERYIEWFSRRENRTAFITHIPWGHLDVDNVHSYQDYLVTKEWMISVIVEERDRNKLLFLLSENPEKEPFSVYLGLTINGTVKLGYLSKKSENKQVSK